MNETDIDRIVTTIRHATDWLGCMLLAIIFLLAMIATFLILHA